VENDEQNYCDYYCDDGGCDEHDSSVAMRRKKRKSGSESMTVSGLPIVDEEVMRLARGKWMWKRRSRERDLVREGILHPNCNPNVRLCFSVNVPMFEHFSGRESLELANCLSGNPVESMLMSR